MRLSTASSFVLAVDPHRHAGGLLLGGWVGRQPPPLCADAAATAPPTVMEAPTKVRRFISGPTAPSYAVILSGLSCGGIQPGMTSDSNQLTIDSTMAAQMAVHQKSSM